MKIAVSLFSLCALLLLAGCSGKEILFLSDHYFAESGYLDPGRQRELARDLGGQGYSLKVEVIEKGPAAEAAVSSLLEKGNPDIVMFSPLLTYDVAAAVHVAPDLFYTGFSFGDTSEEDTFYNRVVFSRIQAFEELGRELGREINAGDGTTGAGGIWYTGTGESIREYQAFRSAFAEECSKELLTIEEVKEIPDGGEIRSFFEDFNWNGVDTGIAFVRSRNGACVREYLSRGYTAVSGNLMPFSDSGLSVSLYSIEYPVNSAVFGAIEMKKSGKESIIAESELIRLKK